MNKFNTRFNAHFFVFHLGRLTVYSNCNKNTLLSIKNRVKTCLPLNGTCPASFEHLHWHCANPAVQVQVQWNAQQRLANITVSPRTAILTINLSYFCFY